MCRYRRFNPMHLEPVPPFPHAKELKQSARHERRREMNALTSSDAPMRNIEWRTAHISTAFTFFLSIRFSFFIKHFSRCKSDCPSLVNIAIPIRINITTTTMWATILSTQNVLELKQKLNSTGRQNSTSFAFRLWIRFGTQNCFSLRCKRVTTIFPTLTRRRMLKMIRFFSFRNPRPQITWLKDGAEIFQHLYMHVSLVRL